eukprot:9821871-Lingulodinium_polyedra.AAC.1
MGLKDCFFVLQEVSNWTHGRLIAGGQFYGGRRGGEAAGTAEQDFTTGIIVPAGYNTAVRAFGGGKHWCGIAVGHVVVLSIHFLWDKYLNIEENLDEADRFIENAKAGWEDRCTVVAGMDANCTLPRCMGGITGDCIRDPLRSHGEDRHLKITAWMEAHDLRAANTFDFGIREESWTCGRDRKQEDRSTIDYLAVSRDLKGGCTTIKEDLEGMGTADHRPLLAVMDWEEERTIKAYKRDYGL